MSAGYVVRYDLVALAALEEAANYIEERSGAGRAVAWLRAMRSGIQSLSTLPKAFGVWAEREGRPLYAKLVPPYRVFYIIDDPSSTVYVVDVVHTARETKLAEYRDPSG